MDTFQGRLIHALKIKKLKQKDVIKALGISKGTASNWVSGKTKPESPQLLSNLSNFLGVRTDWLATGTGEMTVRIYGDPISAWDESTPIEPDEVEIPYYSDLSFACGMGAESVVHEGESRPLRIARSTLKKVGVYKDKTFSAKATGNSMSPIIQDGYTIFVDTGRTQIKDGKIFAISHGGLHSCKILYNLPNGGVRIVSQNTEEYEEIKLTKEQIEQEQFKVIGWVYSWSSLERW